MPLTAKNEMQKGGKTKLEKDSWIAGIFAAAVGLLAWLVDKNDFLGFCRKLISTPFLSVWSFFTHPVTWPVWALILLVVLALGIARAVKIFLRWRASKKAPEVSASAQDYRTDKIFGVQWTWNYLDGQLAESSLTPICPQKDCMHRLESEIRDLIGGRDHTEGNEIWMGFSRTLDTLFCRRCGFRQDLDTNFENHKRNVLFEIERRVRTGEFRQRMGG